MSEQEPVSRRSITIRDADEILEGVCSDCMALSFHQRMEMIAIMAAEQCTFEPGADCFVEYFRWRQMWAGEQGQQFRDAYGVDAQNMFFNRCTFREKQQLAEKVGDINEWLERIDWRGAPVTAEELRKFIFLDESKGAHELKK